MADDSAPSPAKSALEGRGKRQLQRENEILRRIVKDTLWMACRYAHGRQTYAVGMYNDAAREAHNLGIVIENGHEPIFAIDGSMKREYCGLSPAEFDDALARWASPSRIRNHCNIRHPLPSQTDGGNGNG